MSKTKQRDPLKAKSYDEFRRRLVESDCCKCELSKGRTRIVPDRGNPEAKVMAIGEAPGAQEDARGLAFVGRAGKLFDGMMREFGIDTNQSLLIANVAKCRPPGNRPPTTVEAETCLPYLHKQIELVAPRIIILLGATALKRVIPSMKSFAMNKEAGNFFPMPDRPDIECVVFFHPAYLLRSPSKKDVARQYLQKLCDRLSELGLMPDPRDLPPDDLLPFMHGPEK